MDLKQILQAVDLFEGLTESELEQVSNICEERVFHKGELITHQGEPGEEFYIITDGFVEVLLHERPRPGSPVNQSRVIVSLGGGQIIGEMALIDQGPRSASIRAVTEPVVVQVIRRPDFENLCHQSHHIGYLVMQNLAIDLAFKLRHRNLSDR